MEKDEIDSLTYILRGENITLMGVNLIKKVYLVLFSMLIFFSILGVLQEYSGLGNITIAIIGAIIGLIMGYIFLILYENILASEVKEKDALKDKFFKFYNILDQDNFIASFVKTGKLYQVHHLFYSNNGEKKFKYILDNYENYNKVEHDYSEYGPRDGGTKILNYKIKEEINRMKKVER